MLFNLVNKYGIDVGALATCFVVACQEKTKVLAGKFGHRAIGTQAVAFCGTEQVTLSTDNQFLSECGSHVGLPGVLENHSRFSALFPNRVAGKNWSLAQDRIKAPIAKECHHLQDLPLGRSGKTNHAGPPVRF